MSFHYKKKDYSKYDLIVFVIFGIILNVAAAAAVTALKIPLYMDTIGIIFVSLAGGVLPGVFTAIVSSIWINYFVDGYLYFAIINVFVALAAAWYSRFSKGSKFFKFVLFVLVTSVICSVLGMSIQILVPGLPMISNLNDVSKMIYSGDNVAYTYMSLTFVSIFLNLMDKAFALIVAVLLYKLVPEQIRTNILNFGWKQKPLPYEKIRKYKLTRRKKSLLKKVSLWLTATVVVLSITIIWISITFYYEDCKDEYAAEAVQVSQSASLLIDGDKISEFIKWQEKAEGYKETQQLLQILLDNTQGVEKLSVVICENNGYLFLFQAGKEGVPIYDNGIIMPFVDTFAPYMDTLKRGEELEGLIVNDDEHIISASKTIKNSAGETVGYTIADVYMSFLSDYAKDYMIKTFICFSGFIILILIFGFTVAGYDLVFPITSITAAAGMFLDSHGDQKALDDNVRKVRSIAVKTDDEIEDLYSAICQMEAEMAESVRDIRHYAESTQRMQNGLIVTLAGIVENRDSGNSSHVQNTANYVRVIVNGLKRLGYYAEKISDEYAEELEMSAPLHDIGKIQLPEAIVYKDDPLTEEEEEIMKKHTVYGRDIIEKAISSVRGESYLKEARNMAAYHHERWDGKGYPEGLHGEVIPLSARIMALANTLDDLTSRRRHKITYSLEEALEIIESESGKEFDPKCVEALQASLTDLKLVFNNGGVVNYDR